jgi:hypothetical protein
VDPLTAEEILELWERGGQWSPPERAFALLARARRGVTREALESMTIGESEVALLELRGRTFGGKLAGMDSCPGCEALIELEIDPAVVRAMALAAAGDSAYGAAGAEPPVERQVALNVGGWRLRFRLATVGDLHALAAEEVDPARAREMLLERCARQIEPPEGGPGRVEQMPLELQERVAAAMDQADPVAQMTLAVECPACRRPWEATLDVAAFVWREISEMARRLLGEVHDLASRYGWSERAILRLSAVRRYAYLEGRW